MNNSMELYVNKKFDIMKIIKMVLKRKGWGETYTLYNTPTHEITTSMKWYNFEDQFARFKIVINEKAGSGYYSTEFDVYTKREDYTVWFINQLLLKTIKTGLNNMRKNIFEEEARKLYPSIFNDWSKTQKDWIEKFDLQEKIDKINALDFDDEDKERMIDSLVDKEKYAHDRYICDEPRREYIDTSMESNKEPYILLLIDEISKELEESK